MPFLFLTLLSLNTSANDELIRKNALRMVRGEVSSKFIAYRMKTAEGSYVGLVFNEDGDFLKAEGEHPEKDELYIGKFGLSLREAFKLVKKSNPNVSGWKISEENGNWIYSFTDQSPECGEKKIRVDALKGKIIE